MVAEAEKLVGTAVPQVLEVLEKAEPHAEAVTTLVELVPRLEQGVARLEQVLSAVEKAIAAPGSTADRVVGALDAALTPTTVTVGSVVPAGQQQAAEAPAATPPVPAADPLDELTPAPVAGVTPPAAAEQLPEPPAPTVQ